MQNCPKCNEVIGDEVVNRTICSGCGSYLVKRESLFTSEWSWKIDTNRLILAKGEMIGVRRQIQGKSIWEKGTNGPNSMTVYLIPFSQVRADTNWDSLEKIEYTSLLALLEDGWVI